MNTSKIELDRAKPGMKLAEPAYATRSSSMLVAREGIVLDSDLINRLMYYRVKTITVFSEDEKAPIAFSSINPIKPSSVKQMLPPEEDIAPVKPVVSESLKKEAVDSVRQLFSCFEASQGEIINKTTAYQCVAGIEQVVEDLGDVLANNDDGLVHISNLKSFDEYTYHHSLSVALLSMSTGQELGLGRDDIFKLGCCAMMHDIGKQMIPLEIINKKGKLTDEEFATIKNHPTLGASTLRNNDMGDAKLWDAVVSHHEKIDGTGYPKGLQGDDIPLFSKIISVADVYDAVTSYRSYRNPSVPSKAFEIIRKDVGTAFDHDVVEAFFAKLEIYPVNTIVKLSDGRMGVVIDCTSIPERRLRPAIRIWGSKQIEYLAASINRKINIVDVLSNDVSGGV